MTKNDITTELVSMKASLEAVTNICSEIEGASDIARMLDLVGEKYENLKTGMESYLELSERAIQGQK